MDNGTREGEVVNHKCHVVCDFCYGETSNSNDGEQSTAPRDQRPKHPLLIPDPFDGETNFDEWISHFENVAELNGWTDEEKLSWLKVRLISKAHTSFNNLAHVVQQSY